jgi:hypothetical protein
MITRVIRDIRSVRIIRVIRGDQVIRGVIILMDIGFTQNLAGNS